MRGRWGHGAVTPPSPLHLFSPRPHFGFSFLGTQPKHGSRSITLPGPCPPPRVERVRGGALVLFWQALWNTFFKPCRNQRVNVMFVWSVMSGVPLGGGAPPRLLRCAQHASGKVALSLSLRTTMMSLRVNTPFAVPRTRHASRTMWSVL